MSSLGESFDQIGKDTWDYIKKASRGRNASKVERRRVELANTLRSAKIQAAKRAAFDGDKSLRNAYVSYLELLFFSVNDEYKRIVDMEQIAEESYDAMEAYLLTKERVNVKIDSMFEALKAEQSLFAKRHGITLVEGKDSRVERKLDNANDVISYGNKIYLLFFKSNFYEAELIQAQNEGDIGAMEQYRQTLEAVSKEGMDQLKSIPPYKEDRRLREACSEMLYFYHSEAVKYVPGQLSFFEAKDKMETAGKRYQSKSKKSLTQADVDTYNNAVKAYNDSSRSYNETNEFLNKNRSKYLNNFNKARQSFYDRYL